MKRGRFLGVLLLVVAMAASACGSTESVQTEAGTAQVQGGKEESGKGADRNLLNVVGNDPEDVSPFKTDKGTKSLLWSVYESLYDLDPDTGELCPVLADGSRGELGGYRVVDDTTYEIYIHDNIYDHAGNHVTASDVAFTYMNNIKEGYKSYYAKLDNAVAVDDTTVRLNLTAPIENVAELDPYFINIWVYTEAAYNASPSGLTTDACGTGRYKLTDFTSGASLTLEKWEDYWQKDESLINERHQAYVDTIVQHFMSEETQIVIGLETGSIDLCTKISTENCSDFMAGGQYQDIVGVSTLEDNKQLCLTPNCSPESPMSDINLRLACFYAIDNTYVASSLGEGSAAANFALGVKTCPDYNPEWENKDNYQTTYNPELAKEYLAKSNYNGEVLTIMTNLDNNGSYKTVALCISSFLEQIGVKNEIAALDKTTVDSLRLDPMKYDMEIGTALSVTSSVMQMYNFLFNAETTGTGMTQWFIDDPQLQELFEKAYNLDTYSDASVNELYQYVMDNAYAYGLIQYNANVAYRTDKISGITYQGQHLVVPGSCIFN
ncbi:MAG: ABC transporter substrate-binding protein [Clostridium sp.]|nr:ABC transporter substrate-binding protein [Clostridium sp.]